MSLSCFPAVEVLYNTEGRKLDKFIYDHLQPNEEFSRQVRIAIDKICSFLKENCFKDEVNEFGTRIRVLKTVKGGSSGKGTTLKGNSDADLVVFLNVFKNYLDQETNRKMVLREIERRLKQCSREKGFEVDIEPSKWDNPRVLSFRFRHYNWAEYVECDVLPAYDALGHYTGGRPDPQVYVDLINSSSRTGFSTCFTELQKDFIIDRPTKLKSLIRLVKYWYKQLEATTRKLPPKYALELLAVYAWEQGSQKRDFKMEEGFRTVLWLIEHYRELCIFWTEYYNFENETIRRHLQSQLQKSRPIILDPADPTGNVAGDESCWRQLAQDAKFCSSQKCCRNWDGSLVEPWDVSVGLSCLPPVEFLYNTEGRKLDKFIYDYLQPNEAFIRQVGIAINEICTFLKENCFKDGVNVFGTRIRVLKIVKGGSSGKGTTLKGISDADLVVFLDVFKNYQDQETNRKMVLQEIERRLKQCSREKGFEVDIEPSKWDNPRVLSFSFRRSTEHVECDILPAYDALGHYTGGRPDPQVYVDLINSSSRTGFSTCFTELQKDFIIDRPTKLKSLIRLVKYWYKQLEATTRKLPPKYALELLAVYAWEKGSQKRDFKMEEGFRTVLWLIEHYRELCIFWTEYYNFENETIRRYLQSQLQESRPIILDPADPTGNVAGDESCWRQLAQDAKFCSSQKCCRNWDGSLVEPWDVPLQREPPKEEWSCVIL